MEILNKTFTRLNITIVLIVIQVLIYAHLLGRFIYLMPFVSAASSLVSVGIILWLVKKDEAASLRISWILIIVALPISGIILYLLFGNTYPSRKIKNCIAKESDKTTPLLKSNFDLQAGRAQGCIEYIKRASSYPAYKNTQTKYYPLGSLQFEDMLQELDTAKRFIFLEYFIIEDGEMWQRLLEVLMKKVEEGVEVRLIFDDLVSQYLFTGKFKRSLRAKKIKIVRFNPITPLFRPFMNHRDHRKLLIIDGHTCFTGAANIVDEAIHETEDFGVWKDTGIRLKGSAVWSTTLMFIEIWNSFCEPSELINDYAFYRCEETFASDGIVVPYGDSPLLSERIGENVYIDILNQATDYVYIFTPFLIISEKMIYAMQMAAKRGVDVRIVLPGKYDWKRAIIQRVSRSYYKYMLKAGIRIYESPTGYLHAKNFVCDDEIGVIGTINLDYRSLYLHFECAVLLYQSDTIKCMKQDALETINSSIEILPDDKRRIGSYFFDALIHILAPIL